MALKRKEFPSPEVKKEQIEKWLKRPMSWSQISQFKNYGKESWYSRYILDEKSPPNKEMLFGSKIGKLLETDPTYITDVPRSKTMEYELHADLGGFSIIGYADSYGDLILNEYKTGKNEWTQKRVNEHGQLTMYALMLYLKEKIDPKDLDISLHWLPTCEDEYGEIQFVQPMKVVSFKTKRTKKDVLLFASEIIAIRNEMMLYALKHI